MMVLPLSINLIPNYKEELHTLFRFQPTRLKLVFFNIISNKLLHFFFKKCSASQIKTVTQLLSNMENTQLRSILPSSQMKKDIKNTKHEELRVERRVRRDVTEACFLCHPDAVWVTWFWDFRSNWQKDTLLLTVCSFAQFGSVVVYVCCSFCVCSNHVM